MKKRIILYTGSYPYGKTTESFIGPELETVNTLKDYDVTVIPVVKDSPLRQVPDNITLDNSICDAGVFYKIKSFLLIFTPLYISLFIKDRRELTSFRYLCQMLKYLYAANLVYFDVLKRAKSTQSVTFYSYWMSYAPIAFGRYKTKYSATNHHFVTRGHGGDVYTTDRGRYYPFRSFVLNYIDHVYIVSNYGRDYLRNKYPRFQTKIDRAYLGVMPLKVSKPQNGILCKVVSCSSVYDFKRVDLLFRCLEKYANSHPDKLIEWTHFGGGYLFDELEEEIKKDHHVQNFSIVLKGRCNNDEVLRHYCTEDYKVFIHLSTTEGLPVSMMEALSASIPIIATSVGGVPEIVNEQTGQLLNVNFDQKEFDEALDNVLANQENLSRTSNAFYNQNFNAINNYRNFYDTITSL